MELGLLNKSAWLPQAGVSTGERNNLAAFPFTNNSWTYQALVSAWSLKLSNVACVVIRMSDDLLILQNMNQKVVDCYWKSSPAMSSIKFSENQN